MLGICNGFQVLCEAGLLPGALLANEHLRFRCRQVDCVVAAPAHPSPAPAVWARCCRSPSSTRPAATTRRRRCSTKSSAHDQVVLRYAPGANPNGSVGDIAGVCNREGNVLGLMPHPEHAVDPLTGSDDGLALLRSLRKHVDGRVAA